MKKSILLAGAVALVSSVSSQALAQDNAAAVVALFNEGKQLMAQGKVAEACPKFLASYTLEARIGTLVNLANCYETNGQSATAWAKYTEAVSLATKQGEKERADYAREHAAALEPKLSKLTVGVGAQTQGLEVKKDGSAMNAALFGLALPVDPGDHKIEASAPGKKTWSTVVNVGKSADKKSVTVPALEDEKVAVAPVVAPIPVAEPKKADPVAKTDAAPPPAEAPKEAAKEPSKTSTMKIAGLVIAGVGVVGVGVGSVFGINALGKKSDSDAHCVDSRCDAIGTTLREDGRSAGTMSTIFMGVGGAAIVGGVVLWAIAPSASSSVSVSASVDPRSQGLLVKGVW